MWWTCRNTKAKRELGFKPSPHEEALEETIAWYREREGSKLAARGRAPAAALRGSPASRCDQASGLAGRFAS